MYRAWPRNISTHHLTKNPPTEAFGPPLENRLIDSSQSIVTVWEQFLTIKSLNFISCSRSPDECLGRGPENISTHHHIPQLKVFGPPLENKAPLKPHQGRTQNIFSGGAVGENLCCSFPLYDPFISAFYLIRWNLPAFSTLFESFNISFNSEVYIKKNLTLRISGGATAPLAPPLCTAMSMPSNIYSLQLLGPSVSGHLGQVVPVYVALGFNLEKEDA